MKSVVLLCLCAILVVATAEWTGCIDVTNYTDFASFDTRQAFYCKDRCRTRKATPHEFIEGAIFQSDFYDDMIAAVVNFCIVVVVVLRAVWLAIVDHHTE